jgi:hypothetical protein
MRNKAWAGVLAVFVLFPMLSASVKEKPSNGYQQATVLKVEREVVRSPDHAVTTQGTLRSAPNITSTTFQSGSSARPTRGVTKRPGITSLWPSVQVR